MSKLALIEPDPPKRKRSQRRKRRMHPEARMDQIRERVTSISHVPPTGWRYPGGFMVRIWLNDWTKRSYHVQDYASACRLREELMHTMSYSLVVLEQDSG